MTSEPRLETERKPATRRCGAGVRTCTCRGMKGRKNLEQSRKVKLVGVVGVGRVSRADQGDMGEVAGTRPDYAEPPGAMVGAGFILNVVNSYQRGVNDLIYILK